MYLEEEIRAEAIVRKIVSFARFLELAASEAGNLVNYSKLSQKIGIAHSTIASYYQILEDCLIVHRIDPLLISKTRRKLTKSQKYLFFDLGVRRLAAQEGQKLSQTTMGRIFEQFIGLELIRYARSHKINMQLHYWRDPDGPEVDWVIRLQDKFIPIEVKLSPNPKSQDAKHLALFLSEYKQADKGYIVCTSPNRIKLSKNLYAIPWQELYSLFKIR